MGHADGGAEVIRIQLQRLMAIVGRFFELLSARNTPIARWFQASANCAASSIELRRFADRFGVLLVLVQPAQAGQLLLLAMIAVAPPKLANAAVGQEPHAAVAVVQGPAENGVVRIVAQKPDRHDRRPPQHVPAAPGQPLQRAQQIPLSPPPLTNAAVFSVSR